MFISTCARQTETATCGGMYCNVTNTVTVTTTTIHLRGSMSSAIILSAASASFFWSTGTAASEVPVLELGLELELWGKEGLGEENSVFDARVCGVGMGVFCLVF